MHRLQTSLRPSDLQFLKARAQRDGVSIAEVIRQLVKREAEAKAADTNVQSIWDIAGIAVDSRPLLGHVAVSERPEMYLAPMAPPTYARRRTGHRTTPRRRQVKK